MCATNPETIFADACFALQKCSRIPVMWGDMQEQAFNIPFAEDNAGNPCKVPSTAVKLRIKKKRGDGKPGRPKNMCIDGVPFEPALPVTADSVSILPDGDYIADAIDANGQRVGERILFSIEHLRASGANAGQPSSELSSVHAQLMEINKRLQQQTEALHEALLKTANQVCVALEKMTTAQVELTKHLAPVVEAAATAMESARGGGFSKLFEELRAVWDSMPEQGNSNLQTVLSSPLVAGLAHTLQKFIAEAASNAAERVAGGGEPSDTDAARMARQYHRLRTEQERRKAQGD